MPIRKSVKSATAIIALTIGWQGAAFGHKVVHVQNTLYVVICEPGGEAFTFNGTSQGAGEIGSYLCQPSAAGPSGPIEVIEAKPAPRDAASGLPTGKRQHKPLTASKEPAHGDVTVSKAMDKSSPK